MMFMFCVMNDGILKNIELRKLTKKINDEHKIGIDKMASVLNESSAYSHRNLSNMMTNFRPIKKIIIF